MPQTMLAHLTTTTVTSGREVVKVCEVEIDDLKLCEVKVCALEICAEFSKRGHNHGSASPRPRGVHRPEPSGSLRIWIRQKLLHGLPSWYEVVNISHARASPSPTVCSCLPRMWTLAS